MNVSSSTEYDVIFEDEYQRARRRRMLAARLTAKPETPRLAGTLVHDRHEGTGVKPNDAQVGPPDPEPRGNKVRARPTLIRVPEITPRGVRRLREGDESNDRQKSTRLEEAVTFLERELAAGPTSAKVIYERGARAGLSERTTDRAKTQTQIGSKRFETDRGTQWFWYLPGTEPTSLEECVFEEGESGPSESEPELVHNDVKPICNGTNDSPASGYLYGYGYGEPAVDSNQVNDDFDPLAGCPI